MDTAARRASSIAAHGHVRKREGATVLKDATAKRAAAISADGAVRQDDLGAIADVEIAAEYSTALVGRIVAYGAVGQVDNAQISIRNATTVVAGGVSSYAGTDQGQPSGLVRDSASVYRSCVVFHNAINESQSTALRTAPDGERCAKQDTAAIRRDKRYNGGHAVLDGHAADRYRNASRYRINVEYPVKTIAVDDGCAGSRAGDRQVVRDIKLSYCGTIDPESLEASRYSDRVSAGGKNDLVRTC